MCKSFCFVCFLIRKLPVASVGSQESYTFITVVFQRLQKKLYCRLGLKALELLPVLFSQDSVYNKKIDHSIAFRFLLASGILPHVPSGLVTYKNHEMYNQLLLYNVISIIQPLIGQNNVSS